MSKSKFVNIRLLASFCLSALGFLALLSSSSIAVAQTCTGNGQTSTIKFLVGGFGGPAVNDITVFPGDTLYYQVIIRVPPDGSWPATNVDAYLKTADGVVVQFLSH